MVAASQNDDVAALEASMRNLLDSEGHAEAMLPALAYAEAMRASDLLLMPVPKDVIEEIAGRPPHERLH
jgi:hypothetical protein